MVDRHRCHMIAKFGLFVDENHSKLPTLFCLPKLHKRHYKSCFIANFSACTTTELSVLLTSCLTAIKSDVIKYCTTVYERNGKNLFWSIKNSGEILNKLKCRGFLASGFSTHDFSTLNPLPRVGISGTTAKSRKGKFVPLSHPGPFAVVASSRKSQTKVGTVTLACLFFFYHNEQIM